MAIGLVGTKCGMTRVFTEDGGSVPVTVIAVSPNRVTQIKTQDNDGYTAIQVTTGVCKRTRLSKPETGHFAKAGVEPGKGLWEFRVDSAKNIEDLTVGSELKTDRFTVGQLVDVQGTSKGKGYSGVIKRHHFASQDATHGNSLSHRAPGSIGQRQTPGRVFKGKRMAGRMGNVTRSAISQKVVRIDAERNLILIQGAIPGAPGSTVIIRPAVKAKQTGGEK